MSDYRPKQKSLTPLGTVIDKVLRQYRPAVDQGLLQVWDVWEAVVGPAIAANARPAAFKGNILLVHVSNSSWLHHIRFLERELISQINEALDGNRVQAVKLKIGPL